MKQFDDKDREMIQCLRSLGIDRRAAQTLTYLASVPSATARQIDHGAGLRQPEVSLGLKYLRSLGWIEESRRRGNTGRLLTMYQLRVPVSDVVALLEKKAETNLAISKQLVSQVKRWFEAKA